MFIYGEKTSTPLCLTVTLSGVEGWLSIRRNKLIFSIKRH
jgi:hypothetical protein